VVAEHYRRHVRADRLADALVAENEGEQHRLDLVVYHQVGVAQPGGDDSKSLGVGGPVTRHGIQ
jgi:hypothetical protein